MPDVIYKYIFVFKKVTTGVNRINRGITIQIKSYNISNLSVNLLMIKLTYNDYLFLYSFI